MDKTGHGRHEQISGSPLNIHLFRDFHQRLMAWIYEHRKIWRAMQLALLGVAILGPWALERLNVPAEYPCAPPTVRLEGDFCGSPLSGAWILWAFSIELLRRFAELVSGASSLALSGRHALAGLISIMILLPFFSTLNIIIRENTRKRVIFHQAACLLALGASLLIGLSSHPRLYWQLWGIWLYTGIMASALALDLSQRLVSPSSDQG